MTVSTTIIKNFHNGNASTTNFAYQFRILEDTDLLVIIRTNSTGAEATKTLSTHYTVAGAGDASGGSITFTSGNVPASGETVVIRRNVPQTQAIDYIANDPFPAETHEEGLDRGTMVAQQVAEESDRSIKLSRTNTMTSTEFTVGATDRANKVLAFDSSGEISVTQELGTYQGTSATTTTAAFSIRDIVKGSTAAQLNNIYICIQASPIGTALTNTSYWVLIVDAVSAATSAAAAAASATTAGNSATASANSATASANSATTSGNSATASANSATAAASSATDAAASADAFDDIYLGTKSSDPTADNDGDALAAGMLYFNSTNDILRVYSGSAWQDAAISSTGVVTLTGTQTLTNKTLTAPKINENVAVTSTATELNLLDGKAATNLALLGKTEGTNFTGSLLVGHATTGTLSSSENNTGVGIAALNAITQGDRNTAVGTNALTSLTTGLQNTAIGAYAGASINTSGASGNTAVGTYALNKTTGGNNSAVGTESLFNVVGGDYNTGIGKDSGRAINTGSYNIAIGYDGGDNISSGDGNIIIGSVDADSATSDRQLKIAGYDGSTTTTWISGDSNGQVKLISGYIAEVALTDASTITWNAATQPVAKVTLGASRTMGLPANPVSGQFISLLIIQDGTGSRTITWNAAYEFALDTAPTLTATANLGDLFTFRYNGAKWLEVGRNLALTLS